MDNKLKIFDTQQEIKNLKQDIIDLQISILRIQNDFVNNKSFGSSVEPKYWAAFIKENKIG